MRHTKLDEASGESRQGTVARVNPAGLCFVEETESKEIFCFTFDRIDGYIGQTARELRLRPGKRLRFTLDEQRLVERVKLAA